MNEFQLSLLMLTGINGIALLAIWWRLLHIKQLLSMPPMMTIQEVHNEKGGYLKPKITLDRYQKVKIAIAEAMKHSEFDCSTWSMETLEKLSKEIILSLSTRSMFVCMLEDE